MPACFKAFSSATCLLISPLLYPGTGGDGEYRGGDGVIRELEFLRPLTASILSERRAVSPFGILGGQPAARGTNLWIKRSGRIVSLGGKATVQVSLPAWCWPVLGEEVDTQRASLWRFMTWLLG